MTYPEARVLEEFARVIAAAIRVEAMIVANNLRSAHGESQAYPEEQFNTEAAAIEDHANQMRLLAERVEVQP